ncbi:hypothetical protein [Luteimonas salinilitoris]|uniref:Secreted protein n=1 Tax=Luteimonas salinilitoris TaxID=3237697 RepID=A0ABV4HV47_9GAMM
MHARGVVWIGLVAAVLVASIRRMRVVVPVIGMGDDGMFHIVQLAQRAQGGLDHHAERQEHQQSGAQESAVATEGEHTLVAY